MRELARTRQGVSLAQVATEAPPIDGSSYAPHPQRRTGRGRLYAVTAPRSAEVDVLAEPIESETKLRQVFYPAVKPRQIPAQTFPHALTTEEFIEVRLAT